MIVNEEQLKGMATIKIELGRGDIDTLFQTIEALWPVARAARRWVNAPAGLDASNAEHNLVKTLETLKQKESE